MGPIDPYTLKNKVTLYIENSQTINYQRVYAFTSSCSVLVCVAGFISTDIYDIDDYALPL